MAGFRPWGWIIGTGIYVDDVDALAEIAASSASMVEEQTATTNEISRNINEAAHGHC